MAFRLNDDLSPVGSDGDNSEIAELKRCLENGTPAQQQAAIERLIELRAESVLVECLLSQNSVVVRLATGGLWEFWLNEQGHAARREIDKGIKRMNDGDLEGALETFSKLAKKHPDWAEAHNKQATVLYLLGSARLSYKICQTVVALKPHHFGAWNGMAPVVCANLLPTFPLW